MRRNAMRIGILGGSFNPVHAGHVRLAVEACELLHLDRIDLVPAAVPPHKPAAGLLPFGLRCRLLRMAVANLPRLEVNLMEARRRGPSYTWDTLSAYGREVPGARLFFLMGVPDLRTLPTWRRGLELPRRADLVAVARQGMAVGEVQSLVDRCWPGAAGPEKHDFNPEKGWGNVLVWRLPGDGQVALMNPPCLEISATLVRNYWMQGRELGMLVPDAVLRELQSRRKTVHRFWCGMRQPVSGTGPTTGALRVSDPPFP